ncbi:unnamed protein product [Meganyctiphanes norvegica]|uniref:Uncharacterized protein n=1 Tax=Meganyctiphanes norvegica TaxID=48144 RepID=A0AAV2R3Z6_MEGNR
MIFCWPKGPAKDLWEAAKVSLAGPPGQPECYCWPKGPAKDCRTNGSAAVTDTYLSTENGTDTNCRRRDDVMNWVHRKLPDTNYYWNKCTIFYTFFCQTM